MGKFKVFFSERALKDINAISDADFDLITNKCKRLEDNPVPDGKHIKKLKGYAFDKNFEQMGFLKRP